MSDKSVKPAVAARLSKVPKVTNAPAAATAPEEAMLARADQANKGRKSPAPGAKAVKAERADKPEEASKPVKPDKAVKIHKPRKALVRDSFTMPEADFALIAALKERALGAGRPAKKSELLRAGLQALAALDVKKLRAALERLETIKVGRPKRA